MAYGVRLTVQLNREPILARLGHLEIDATFNLKEDLLESATSHFCDLIADFKIYPLGVSMLSPWI